MAANEEFVPVDFFTCLSRFWWIVVVCAVVGGGAGLFIHRLRPPIYEAQAVFLGSIDFNKIDFVNPPEPTPAPYQFSQYDEDIALALIEGSLRQVVPQVVEFAQQNGIQVDASGLLAQTTIEREHAYWEIRYRSSDPLLAQKIVNFWAEVGLEDMKVKHANGQIPAFVIFDLIQLADVPSRPVFYQTNTFVLAGAFLGLIVGLAAANLLFFRMRKDR